MSKKCMAMAGFFTLILSAGCAPTTDDIFDQVKEDAPEICKQFCASYVTCEMDETSGLEQKNAYDDAVGACEVVCAWATENGVYVETHDPEGDDDAINASVDGETFQTFMECVWDSSLFTCDEGEYEYEYQDSKNSCNSLDYCLTTLAIDWSVKWDTDGNYCDREGDDSIWPDIVEF